LPHADAEVAELIRHVADPVVFRHPVAAADDVLKAMDGAFLAHIAAHGQLRTDNPLFSALLMDDGPMTVYDIEGVGVAPEIVILPSCESGVSASRAGDELLGLVAALLSIGTRSVIATGIATPDAMTSELMLRLHEALRAGHSPAAALAAARARLTRLHLPPPPASPVSAPDPQCLTLGA
jgi:CHAT domain-containing protein